MLIMVLMMSATLLIIVLGSSDTQISASYQNLNTNSNKAAYYNAESCYEEAARRLKEDATYIGETITFDYGSCTISIVGSDTKTVSVTTQFNGYTQYYQAEILIIDNGEINNVRLLNWQKI